MIAIHHILCPIDFSDTSRHALQHATAIAKWYQADIAALHVIHAAITVPPPPILAAVSGTPMSPGERESLGDELRDWLAPARSAGVKAEIFIDEGNAPGRILAFEESHHPDLIVMGTHGLGGVDRFLLGSVAEKVLRKSACPVLIVPPAAAAEVKIPYRRLVCAVDFSEPSLSALRFACSIAEEADAELTILHVFDWPQDDPFVERFNGPEFRRLVEHDVRGRLEALVTDELRTWCRPTTKIAYGKPYREILALAEHEGADLIVIGVRGRNPLDMMLFGSTANHVVRRATCPVLTLKQ